jgi:hypothetical protein
VADQKKWFKVWTTILLDPHHMNMSLENVGRWTRLGALMVSQGDSGKLVLIPPAKSFLVAMECATFDAAIDALRMLPNVQIEEGKFDNGKTTVIMSKWFKYQVDSTGYERVKRSRYKRRGEESRKEESRKEENTPPKPPQLPFSQPTPQEVTAYAKSIGFRLDGEKFVAHYESNGWKVGRNPMVSWQSAVVTWKKGADPAALIPLPRPIDNSPAPKPEDLVAANQVTELVKSLAGKVVPK